MAPRGKKKQKRGTAVVNVAFCRSLGWFGSFLRSIMTVTLFFHHERCCYTYSQGYAIHIDAVNQASRHQERITVRLANTRKHIESF